jgi:hypothetical protein
MLLKPCKEKHDEKKKPNRRKKKHSYMISQYFRIQ